MNLLRNGGFEWGFGDDGVAQAWQRFDNGSATFIFMAEPWDAAILDGDNAQRITITNATQPDRYAGIYQTVGVTPGEAYRLTLNGQVRSTFGDVADSQYGYRMQYAVDWSGGTDWQNIPADEWIELPWDEQFIDGENMFFLDYTTDLVPPTGKLTLFIRAWNKWPDKLEAQYTLDSLSLVGPQPMEEMFNQPLPTTGGSVQFTLPSDPRVWGSVALLLFLLGGALWRWRYSQHIR